MKTRRSPDVLAWRRFILFVGATVLPAGGCAFGQTVDYHSAVPKLAWRSDDVVALAVVDQRPEIVDGRRPPNWVGASRGGLGNPFELTTADGKPLSANLAGVVTRGLEKAGMKVLPLAVQTSATEPELAGALAATHAQRAVIVKITKWKSDSLMRTSLRYAFFAKVTDGQGRRLGQAAQTGDEVMAAGIYEVKEELSRTYGRVVDALLNDPSLAQAMRPDAQPLAPPPADPPAAEVH